MFKGLGEFIDFVGRATGRKIGQLFSDDEPVELDGDIIGLPANLPEDIREILNDYMKETIVVYDPNDKKDSREE